MRWVRARPPAGTPTPPTDDVATLAGASAYGQGGGSGMVEARNQLQSYDGGATLVPSRPQQLVADVPALPDLPPDSYYADRPLYGGVSTLSAPLQYRGDPPMGGAFRVLTNRAPMTGVEAMQAQPYVVAQEFRDPPAIVNLCRTVRSTDVRSAVNGFTDHAPID